MLGNASSRSSSVGIKWRLGDFASSFDNVELRFAIVSGLEGGRKLSFLDRRDRNTSKMTAPPINRKLSTVATGMTQDAIVLLVDVVTGGGGAATFFVTSESMAKLVMWVQLHEYDNRVPAADWLVVVIKSQPFVSHVFD